MSVNRRTALRTLAAAGAALGAVPAAAAGKRPPRAEPKLALGLLYDATLCIGCKACMVACREANDLPAARSETTYFEPSDLNAHAKTVIKLYAEDERTSYFKAQCMHCIDPACASACMLGAFDKRIGGAVTWEGDKCVGCRYCQIACPFNVPKFDWDSATPKLVKCELCAHLLAQGREPACSDVCPRQAIIFGTRSELLKEAHRRIEAEPQRYQPRVYGETEGGGTQVLYLSAHDVPFEKLGLPALGAEPAPALSETVQHSIYQGFVAPVALYGILGGVIWRNRRLNEQRDREEEQ